MAWNRPSTERAPVKKKGGGALSSAKGILIGLAVAVSVAALLVWAFSSDEESLGKDAKRETRIAERSAEGRAQRAGKSEKREVRSGERSAESSEHNTEEARSAKSEGSGEGDAQSAKVDEKKRRRTFPSGTDELIAMAMSTPPGGQIPPLPDIGRGETKQFIESLKKPIEIAEDDSDSVKAIKQIVQNTREEIAQLMEENPNMSFGDILQEHRKIHNENSDIRGQTISELLKIVEEGDIEGAKKFRTTMNFALQQMGIEEMDTPITPEEKAEAEARAEEEALAEDARIKEEQKNKEQKK